MLNFIQAATWLFTMTPSVRPAYASVTPAPPLRRVIPGLHRPYGEGQDCPILNSEGDRQRLSIDDGDELRGVDALALTPRSDDVDVRVSQLGAAEQHPYAVEIGRAHV